MANFGYDDLDPDQVSALSRILLCGSKQAAHLILGRVRPVNLSVADYIRQFVRRTLGKDRYGEASRR
jgi:hypothetical protein